MTEINKKSRPERSGRKPSTRSGRSRERENSPDAPPTQYTPQQRERIRNGLRVWARVAVRSYLRRQRGESQAGAEPLEEED